MSLNHLKSYPYDRNQSHIKIEQLVTEPKTTFKQFSELLSTRSSDESIEIETDKYLKGETTSVSIIKNLQLDDLEIQSQHTLHRKADLKKDGNSFKESDYKKQHIQKDSVPALLHISIDPKGKSPSVNAIYFSQNENSDVKNKKNLSSIKSTNLLILQTSSKSAERQVPLGNLTFGMKAPLNLKYNVEDSISQISSQSSLSIDSINYDLEIQKDQLFIDNTNDNSLLQSFGGTDFNNLSNQNQSKFSTSQSKFNTSQSKFNTSQSKFNTSDLASEQEKAFNISASSSDSMIFPLDNTKENTQTARKLKHFENSFPEAYFLKLCNSNDDLSASTKFKYPSINLAKNNHFNSSFLDICNRDLSLDSLELEQPPESFEMDRQFAKDALFKENLVFDPFPKESANELVSKNSLHQVVIGLDSEKQIMQGSIPESGMIIEQAFKVTETQNILIEETELMPIKVDSEKKNMSQQLVDHESEIVEAPFIPIETNMSHLQPHEIELMLIKVDGEKKNMSQQPVSEIVEAPLIPIKINMSHLQPHEIELMLIKVDGEKKNMSQQLVDHESEIVEAPFIPIETNMSHLQPHETELMLIKVDGEKKNMSQQLVDHESEIVEAPLIPIETNMSHLQPHEIELMPIKVDGEKKNLSQQLVDHESEIVEVPLIPIETNMSHLQPDDYITKNDSFPKISEIKNELEIRFENDAEYDSLDLNPPLKNEQENHSGSTQESEPIGKEQNNKIVSCKRVKTSKYRTSFRKKKISKKGLANNFKLDPFSLFQYLEENLKSQKFCTGKKSLYENKKSECNNLEETLQDEKEFDSKVGQFIFRISQDYGLDIEEFTNRFNHDFQPFLKNHINNVNKSTEKTTSLDLAMKKGDSKSARLEKEAAMKKVCFLEKELLFEKSHYRFEKKLLSKQILKLEKLTNQNIDKSVISSSKANNGRTDIQNSLEKKYYLDRILELKKNCADLALDKTDLLAQIELYAAENQSLQFSLNEKSQIIVENTFAISNYKLQNSNLLDSLKKVQISEVSKENEMKQLNDALFEKELQCKHFITEKCFLDERNAKKEIELNTEIDKLKIEACDLKMKLQLLQSDNEKKSISIEQADEELRNLKSNLVRDVAAKDQTIQKLDRDLFEVKILLENSEKLFSERESQLQNELKTKSKKYATELAQLAFKCDSDLVFHKENQEELNNEISKLEFILAEKDEIIKKRKDDCLKLEEQLQMNFNFKEENMQLANVCKKLENETTFLKLQLSEAKEMKSKKLKITSELEKQLAQYQQKNENLVKKLTEVTNLVNETKRKLDFEKESTFATISKNNALFSEKIKNLQDIIAAKDALNSKMNQDKEIQMQKNKVLEEDLKKLKIDNNLNASGTDINLLQSENWDLAAKLDYSHIIMAQIQRDFKEKVQAMQSINTIRLRKSSANNVNSKIPRLKIAWYDSKWTLPTFNEKDDMTITEKDYYMSILTQKDIAIGELRFHLAKANQKIKLKTKLMKALLSSKNDLEERLSNRFLVDQKCFKKTCKSRVFNSQVDLSYSLQNNALKHGSSIMLSRTSMNDNNMEKIENLFDFLFLKLEESEKERITLQKQLLEKESILDDLNEKISAFSSLEKIEIKQEPLIDDSVDFSLMDELSAARNSNYKLTIKLIESNGRIESLENLVLQKDIEILEISQQIEILSAETEHLRKENLSRESDLNNCDVLVTEWVQISKKLEEKEQVMIREKEEMGAILNSLCDIEKSTPGLPNSWRVLVHEFKNHWLKDAPVFFKSSALKEGAFDVTRSIEILKSGFIIENLKTKLQKAEEEREQLQNDYNNFQDEQHAVFQNNRDELKSYKEKLNGIEKAIPNIVKEILTKYHWQNQKNLAVLSEVQKNSFQKDQATIEKKLSVAISALKENNDIFNQNMMKTSELLSNIGGEPQLKEIVIESYKLQESDWIEDENRLPTARKSEVNQRRSSVNPSSHNTRRISSAHTHQSESIAPERIHDWETGLTSICETLRLNTPVKTTSNKELLFLINTEVENLMKALQKSLMDLRCLQEKNEKIEDQLKLKMKATSELEKENIKISKTLSNLSQKQEIQEMELTSKISHIESLEKEKHQLKENLHRAVMNSEHLENNVNNQRNDLLSANEIIKKCQAMLEKLSNEKLEMDSLRRTNAELEDKVSKLNTSYKIPGPDADQSLDFAILSNKQTSFKEKSISQLLQYQNQNAEFEKAIELEKREKEFQALNRKLVESQELQKDMMRKIEFLSENLPKEPKNLSRLNTPPIQVIPLFVNDSVFEDSDDLDDQNSRRLDRINRLKKIMKENISFRRKQIN